MIPEIENYGKYSSDNYGVHTLLVNLGEIELYYSYETIVAFADSNGLVCSENYWTVTTGKHLNWIQPDKSKRVKHDKFTELLQNAIAKHIK